MKLSIFFVVNTCLFCYLAQDQHTINGYGEHIVYGINVIKYSYSGLTVCYVAVLSYGQSPLVKYFHHYLIISYDNNTNYVKDSRRDCGFTNIPKKEIYIEVVYEYTFSENDHLFNEVYMSDFYLIQDFLKLDGMQCQIVMKSEKYTYFEFLTYILNIETDSVQSETYIYIEESKFTLGFILSDTDNYDKKNLHQFSFRGKLYTFFFNEFTANTPYSMFVNVLMAIAIASNRFHHSYENPCLPLNASLVFNKDDFIYSIDKRFKINDILYYHGNFNLEKCLVYINLILTQKEFCNGSSGEVCNLGSVVGNFIQTDANIIVINNNIVAKNVRYLDFLEIIRKRLDEVIPQYTHLTDISYDDLEDLFECLVIYGIFKHETFNHPSLTITALSEIELKVSFTKFTVRDKRFGINETILISANETILNTNRKSKITVKPFTKGYVGTKIFFTKKRIIILSLLAIINVILMLFLAGTLFNVWQQFKKNNIRHNET